MRKFLLLLLVNSTILFGQNYEPNVGSVDEMLKKMVCVSNELKKTMHQNSVAQGIENLATTTSIVGGTGTIYYILKYSNLKQSSFNLGYELLQESARLNTLVQNKAALANILLKAGYIFQRDTTEAIRMLNLIKSSLYNPTDKIYSQLVVHDFLERMSNTVFREFDGIVSKLNSAIPESEKIALISKINLIIASTNSLQVIEKLDEIVLNGSNFDNVILQFTALRDKIIRINLNGTIASLRGAINNFIRLNRNTIISKIDEVAAAKMLQISGRLEKVQKILAHVKRNRNIYMATAAISAGYLLIDNLFSEEEISIDKRDLDLINYNIASALELSTMIRNDLNTEIRNKAAWELEGFLDQLRSRYPNEYCSCVVN